MSDKELKYYKKINAAFIGKKVVEIYYEELNYGIDSEFWEHSNHIHSIDMNVIFRLDSNELIQIKWDSEFYNYGIGFEKLTKINKRDHIKTITLSDNHHWQRLKGKKITEITVFWDESYSQEIHQINNYFIAKEEKKKIKLPQTWQIEFGNRKIWISALEIIENGINSYWADHLTILFTKSEQEKYKLVDSATSQQQVTAIV